jgi:hypothetical protein
MTKTIPTDKDLFRRCWEQQRRANEAATPARAYRVYRKIGYTKKGARAMVEQDAAAPSEAWLDEWFLLNHGKPSRPAPRDVQAFAPFAIEEQHAGYEWLLLSAGRDPNHPWFRAIAERPEDFNNRVRVLLAFAPEAYRNLCRSIDRERIEPDRWVYRQNQIGETEVDHTRCVISREAMLDFFRRIGGYGKTITELLQAQNRSGSQSDGPLHEATPAKKRRHGYKREKVQKAMRDDIAAGKITRECLKALLEKLLASRYSVSRDTARKARTAVLTSDESIDSVSTNDK